MPVNPKVEIPLQKLKDFDIIECFDQIRRWFLNYEQNNVPTIQSFEGVLDPGQRLTLNVPGKLYGVIGQTTLNGLDGSTTGVKSNGVTVWYPMVFQGGVGYARFLGATEGSITVDNNTPLYSNSYRITAFYRK